MIKKFLGFLAFFLIAYFLSFVAPVHAEGEFSSSYDTTYDVDTSGVTTVTEKITFKNLTDRFYASNFSLTIGATQISDVSAVDSTGATLQTSQSSQGKKTLINVKFNNQQVVGKGKTLVWTLNYKSKDFATNIGKVWQISIPKLRDTTGIENYDLTLTVPTSFGDPTSIVPEPVKYSGVADKINFEFSKNQISNAGILANFGEEQLIDFKATFNVVNNRLLPYLVKLPLPPNTNYQDVAIDNIIPPPENVLTDDSGNLVAYFNLDRKQTIQVTVLGRAQLHIQNKVDQLGADKIKSLTAQDKFWEKDNPLIQSKLTDIFKDLKDQSNYEKAKLINKFIVNSLQFDFDRLRTNDFQRFGAVTAINNPDKVMSAEYVDLFIALARAAKIPTRQLVGFAISTNSDLRPISYQGKIVHSWVEFFDPAKGWLSADPTWESTSGGVDFFGIVDLNHLVLERFESVPTDSFQITNLDAKFSDDKLVTKPELVLNIDSPGQILAGFPSQVKISVENHGTKTLPPATVKFSSGQIQIVPLSSPDNMTEFSTPQIAPFGVVNYRFNLKTAKLWESYDDELVLQVGDQKTTKKITIRPLFANQYFSAFVIGGFVFILIMYAATLTLHVRSARKNQVSK